MTRRSLATMVVLFALAGCEGNAPGGPTSLTAERRGEASVYWERDRLSPEEIERMRREGAWRRVVALDSIVDADEVENPESWEQITPQAVNAGPMHLPLHGDVAGPSVLRAQILLDRAHFSPGIIDGRWGDNTEKAIYWFQRREGLPATARLDSATFVRLVEVADPPRELVRAHRLTEQDVSGPFVKIPEDIYEHAELDCSCYESLTEKLTERFQVTEELLRRLNPGAELNGLTAGTLINVPAVRSEQGAYGARIDRIEISDRGRYLHALGMDGEILFHFPATLGSQYDPSPEGEYRVTSITRDPWWHYQPDILSYADDDEPDAHIPPGPNNAVGVVWMALDKPHYGIHGTNSPHTIGYATSAGCVRLTNWDALFLARRLREGTTVVFRDTG